jgi:hypothetical protein
MARTLRWARASSRRAPAARAGARLRGDRAADARTPAGAFGTRERATGTAATSTTPMVRQCARAQGRGWGSVGGPRSSCPRPRWALTDGEDEGGPRHRRRSRRGSASWAGGHGGRAAPRDCRRALRSRARCGSVARAAASSVAKSAGAAGRMLAPPGVRVGRLLRRARGEPVLHVPVRRRSSSSSPSTIWPARICAMLSRSDWWSAARSASSRSSSPLTGSSSTSAPFRQRRRLVEDETTVSDSSAQGVHAERVARGGHRVRPRVAPSRAMTASDACKALHEAASAALRGRSRAAEHRR